MAPLTPAAERALKALSAFHPRNHAEARALLSSWAGRATLTASDVHAVLKAATR